MKSDSLSVKYLENGLECANVDQYPAGVIIFGIGFVGNLSFDVVDIFGVETASQLEDYWGLDEEGELKGDFKFSGRKFNKPAGKGNF